jgi:hypothetical protein
MTLATYSPAELVLSSRTIPVPAFFKVTEALGITAPVLSRIVPVRVAVSCREGDR